MAQSLAPVLHHHGITGEGDTLTDNAREAGLIYACLGCGTVGGIDPAASLGEHATFENARAATRDAIDWDAFDCCPDSTTILF